MTTTTDTGPTTGPAVDYPMPWTKGAYIARIIGPHGRYGLEREFLTGTTQKARQRVTYTLQPGWYEIQDKPGRRVLLAVDTTGQTEELPIPTTREGLRLLGKAGRRGETIDTPGAWNGRHCWCGDNVTAYTPAGRARCDQHHKETTT